MQRSHIIYFKQLQNLQILQRQRPRVVNHAFCITTVAECSLMLQPRPSEPRGEPAATQKGAIHGKVCIIKPENQQCFAWHVRRKNITKISPKKVA